MRKVFTGLILLVLLFAGCDTVDKIPAFTKNVSDFNVLEDDARMVEPGTYQSGVLVYGEGIIDINITGNARIDFSTTYYRQGSGEYWFFISTSGLPSGDTSIIESRIIDGSYYPSEGPKYKTYTLVLEVE